MAFERLARIAAGLESRVLGELEILGQVREAYRVFKRNNSGPEAAWLDRLFQKALALSRKARRESGIDRNMTSLSGLAARDMLRRVAPGMPLAVVGSGSLAGPVARYLGKRGRSPVRISSRCPGNALRLALEVDGFGAGLDELAPLLRGVGGIITATAAPHPVLYSHHLAGVCRPLFITDLGVPPDCHDAVPELPWVRYHNLAAVEARAHVHLGERTRRAEVAARTIRDGALAWARER
jgi:glutamyl-tRNA reductase